MRELSHTTSPDIRTTLSTATQIAVAEVGRVRDKLAHRQKPWEREHRMRDQFIDPYYETFKPVLGGETIVQVLRKMKENKAPGEKFVVMDIMGTGSVFENLPEDARPDIVIAMTLVDYRTPQEKANERRRNIHVIGTDKDNLQEPPTSVALPHTWHQLEKLLKELHITTIDFAVARPLGGMHTIPQNEPWFWGWMIQKVYKHLHPTNGMLLTEAPQGTFDFLRQWSIIANQRGIDVTCGFIHDDPDFAPLRPALKILRRKNSPESIY